MATITLGDLRDLWKTIADWVSGDSSDKPDVNISDELPSGSNTIGNIKITDGADSLEIDSDGNITVVEKKKTEKEVKRKELESDTEDVMTFDSECDYFEIQNLGTEDIYIDIDSTASIDGSDDILIPGGSSYITPIGGTEVHIKSENTPKIQVIGVR